MFEPETIPLSFQTEGNCQQGVTAQGTSKGVLNAHILWEAPSMEGSFWEFTQVMETEKTRQEFHDSSISNLKSCHFASRFPRWGFQLSSAHGTPRACTVCSAGTCSHSPMLHAFACFSACPASIDIFLAHASPVFLDYGLCRESPWALLTCNIWSCSCLTTLSSHVVCRVQ